jgi:hypothetical protein
VQPHQAGPPLRPRPGPLPLRRRWRGGQRPLERAVSVAAGRGPACCRGPRRCLGSRCRGSNRRPREAKPAAAVALAGWLAGWRGIRCGWGQSDGYGAGEESAAAQKAASDHPRCLPRRRGVPAAGLLLRPPAGARHGACSGCSGYSGGHGRRCGRKCARPRLQPAAAGGPGAGGGVGETACAAGRGGAARPPAAQRPRDAAACLDEGILSLCRPHSRL